MSRLLAVAILLLISSFGVRGEAAAQEAPPMLSQCQAIAQSIPQVWFASFGADQAVPATSEGGQVVITFLGHSTFLIETPGGVSIATDYNGWYGPPTPPTVVTMNKAHITHFTLTPDSAIAHVLRGWGDDGEPADHNLVVDDVFIRNVTTDIRAGGGMEHDANSIFIFEVAGLCIGHLGHLHHELDASHYAAIGRLDVLMVPVDGGLTMGADSMSRVVKQLRSSLILPMHRRGPPIDAFLALFDHGFDREIASDSSITVSLSNLPKRPLIYVLKGV
ncbi:MBL fold metallo-hydrolase [Rhizobiaceae bacterium n13]|uniref:MBL fold metallo-hydrolase n=1 Tax=Ferirhizobium litorale TaxID=2927786 RepID=UPI0024B2B4D6|nr:MBL fold metallo-hydrolase [Fererhizobium litorale]MDI7860571.1 MBL fold metallo-hydrolase [Fererhizobium litorale]